MSTPTRRTRSACCARAASGHAAAAPPSSVTNSRRSHSITSSAATSSFRHGEAERLGGLEIDDEFELGRLHDRQVCRLLALKNPSSIDAGSAVGIGYAGSVAHQTTHRDELSQRMDRRNTMTRGEPDDLFYWEVRNGPVPTSNPPALWWTNVAKAASMSRTLKTSETTSRCPNPWPHSPHLFALPRFQG